MGWVAEPLKKWFSHPKNGGLGVVEGGGLVALDWQFKVFKPPLLSGDGLSSLTQPFESGRITRFGQGCNTLVSYARLVYYLSLEAEKS